MENEYTIFYSWQSDLPNDTNKNAIRQALRIASNNIEKEVPNISIKLDEATRDMPGSPNIPNAIFSKIENADIFVCDLSTINKDAPEGQRKVQNPNVLIELGYSITQLGWERIIILFNTNYGVTADLPFDIDRHRASTFLIKDRLDKDGIKNLERLLTDAVKLIIDKNPPLPSELKQLSPEERKRQRDISNLELVLSTIHIPTFDAFIDDLPKRIIGRIFPFWYSFSYTMESNLFYIYDETAREMLARIKELWNKSLSNNSDYHPDQTSDNFIFYTPGDVFRNSDSEKAYHDLEKIAENLRIEFKKLLEYIRKEYIQIDLKKTSQKAAETYRDEQEKINKKLFG